MKIQKQYPTLKIYTINQLANKISGRGLSYGNAVKLINDCIKNKNSYWWDVIQASDLDNDKWVRSAKGTQLGLLLERIDKNLLKPYDNLLPSFIYGGLTNKNCKDAAIGLRGNKNKRTILKLDMQKCFEHIDYEEVIKLFCNKFGCRKDIAKTIAYLVCVPEGPKTDNQSDKLVLGRGFCTSTRIAIWCNLDLFFDIFWLEKNKLKKYDPRIAIFVDDIGISASRVSPIMMTDLYKNIRETIKKNKPNIKLNSKKAKLVDYRQNAYDLETASIIKNTKEPFEFLGIEIGRNSLRAGLSSRAKLSSLKSKKSLTNKQKSTIRGLKRFVRYISRK